MQILKISNLISNKLLDIDNQINNTINCKNKTTKNAILKQLYEYREDLLNERQILIDLRLIEKTN